MTTKFERQGAILRLVQQQQLSTQAEVAEALRSNGIEAVQATVSRDIAELRQRLQHLHKARCPEAQLLWVWIFEAVLILRAADAVLDGQVLHRLQKEGNALDVGQGRL